MLSEYSATIIFHPICPVLSPLLSGDGFSVFPQARDELTEQLDRFQDQVIKVSLDMTKAQWKRAQRMHAAESIPIQ